MVGSTYPVSSKTRPNPYLEDLQRDIQIPERLKLTKINPAHMTRQISEIASKQGQVQFHLTSLKPIRPENRPTPREEKALIDFEKGMPEVGYILSSETDDRYFYMAPLKAERVCLTCHAKQGCKEGDIRGGISVTLSFLPEIPILALGLGHGLIGLVGILGIIAFGTQLKSGR